MDLLQTSAQGTQEAHETQRDHRKKCGSLLWELVLVLGVLFAFIYCAMTFIGMYVQYESLSYAAKTVARQIEITGSYDQSVINQNMAQLTANANLHDIVCTVEVGPVPAGTDPALGNTLAARKNIQLRQSFTLTVKATHTLHLIGSTEEGEFLSSLTIPVPMTYQVAGMSEVYFRE